MDDLQFFKGIVDSSISPIVICNMDYRIVYINPTAREKYKNCSKNVVVGASIRPFFDEEALSKLDMSIEWFKESENNNRVFSRHVEDENADYYLCAIRNEQKELIGFFNYHMFRDHETGKSYDMD